MKRIKKTASAVEIKSSMSTASQEIAALRDLTAKQLVEKGKKEFGQHLNLDNGRTWLLKKVGYLIQEKMVGHNEVTAGRAADLENAERIAEMKAEDAKKDLLDAAQHHKPKAAATAKKESRGKDEDGFRIDSFNSRMFGALKRGCTMADLEVINAKRAKGFCNWIQKPVGTVGVAEARNAKIAKQGEKMIISSYDNVR